MKNINFFSSKEKKKYTLCFKSKFPNEKKLRDMIRESVMAGELEF